MWYYCACIHYFLANFPAAAVHAFIHLISTRAETHGRIRISCIDEGFEREFQRVIVAALEFISTNDRLRHKRLESQIHRIVCLPMKGGASYFRLSRVCVIDLTSLKRLAPEMDIVPLAA